MTRATAMAADDPRDPARAYWRARPRVSYVQPDDPWLRARLIGLLEVCLGRRRIQQIYDELSAPPFDPAGFFGAALAAGGIELDYDPARLQAVPASGPVVFVANHPFGIVDGLALCQLALLARGDFRILIHAMLCQDRQLARYFLPIDFQDSTAAQRNNIRSKQQALAALADGVPVLIFPAGGVSTAGRLGFGTVTDLPWTTFGARLIQQSGATVVPLRFHGANSLAFQLASQLGEPLRLAMLTSETLNRFGQPLKISIGEPLTPEQLGSASRRELTDALRRHVYGLD